MYDEDTYAYYNTNTAGYVNIGSDIAGSGYDAATANMGAPWRMPSVEQQQELINNCTSQWTQQNGVNGILMTGLNGGQVFLPAAAEVDGSSSDRSGGYRSSSLHPIDDGCAYYFYFDYTFRRWDYNDRIIGRSVRAVRP